MAYVNGEGSHLQFFVPAIQLAENAAEVLKEIDIGAASGTHGELVCVKPCKVKRFQFVLSGELAGGTTTAPTVVFKKRPTPFSSSGQSTLATLTVPDATGIGKCVYKEISPVSMNVGDTIQISWTVGVGTPTGMGYYSIICEDEAEVPGNNSDMIASA